MKLIQNKNIFQKSDYFVLLPKEQKIMPIKFFSEIKYIDLINIDEQKLKLFNNLESYSLNNDSEHTLLCGSRGCGKSTLVKLSIEQLNRQIKKKIKLIEVFNLSLDLIADLSFILTQYNYKFIIFIDDLNLNVSDENFKYIKSLIEGSLISSMKNIKFYVTSNLRNLSLNVNHDSYVNDIEIKDMRENMLSLVDRFGCKIIFYDFNQDEYLKIVDIYLKDSSIDLTEDIKSLAIQWSIQKGNFSGRTAHQFVRNLIINNN